MRFEKNMAIEMCRGAIISLLFKNCHENISFFGRKMIVSLNVKRIKWKFHIGFVNILILLFEFLNKILFVNLY